MEDLYMKYKHIIRNTIVLTLINILSHEDDCQHNGIL